MSNRRKPHDVRLRQFDENLARGPERMAERIRERVPQCWFCSTVDGRKSKEHIFPKWLTAHFNARPEVVTPGRVSAATGEELSRRPPKPLSAFVCSDVCQDCNNGWMSVMEQRVRPILTREKRTGRLSGEEAFVLAHWFVKTAAVLNVSQPYRLLFPARERHSLANGLPLGATVRLFKSRRQDGLVDWVQGGHLGALSSSEVPEERVRGLLERILVTHIRVADLVGVVVLTPPPLQPESVLDVPNASARIWPPPPRLPTWGGLPRRKDYLDHFVTVDVSGLSLGW
jgi:hypothetical protein